MTDIVAYKGRTKRLEFQATVDGDPLDLTGQTLYFTVKRRLSDPDAEAVVLLTNGSGISVTNAVTGVGQVRIPPADLSEMPDYESAAEWELVVVDAQDNSYRIDGGQITVRPSVLQSEPA